jgi:multicopper oxidase
MPAASVRARFRKVTLPVTHTDRRTLLRSGLAATTLGVLGAATAASPAKPGTAAGGPQVPLGDGVFPLVALAEGKNSTALALVSTGMGTPPAPDVLPRELYSPVTTSSALKPTAAAALSARQPDVMYKLQLTGGMARYNWGINGQSFDMTQSGALRYLMKQGQRVRVIFTNTTTMYHPMHIHGHTFQIAPGGPRKDTVLVLPRQQVACDFDVDNPGQWMTHCHNL